MQISNPVTVRGLFVKILLVISLLLIWGGEGRAFAEPSFLARYLEHVPAGSLVEGADGYGAMQAELPVVPVLRAGEAIGWAFITSDFVGTTGYSGKPIHVMVAVDDDAVIIGVGWCSIPSRSC
jgi:NosR/NirI family transcriptional regulator, nitrous oxide reductase regulator